MGVCGDASNLSVVEHCRAIRTHSGEARIDAWLVSMPPSWACCPVVCGALSVSGSARTAPLPVDETEIRSPRRLNLGFVKRGH